VKKAAIAGVFFCSFSRKEEAGKRQA